jgi:hypothetical protein
LDPLFKNLVGDAVTGLFVGLFVGELETDGAKEGFWLIEGFSLGETDGLELGLSEGAKEGFWLIEGLSLGRLETDGLKLGLFEGLSVGAGHMLALLSHSSCVRYPQ